MMKYVVDEDDPSSWEQGRKYVEYDVMDDRYNEEREKGANSNH